MYPHPTLRSAFLLGPQKSDRPLTKAIAQFSETTELDKII
jgi:hypothetical protein